MVNEQELREYYNFFTGLWKLFKEYHHPKTDDEWDVLIEEGEKLVQQTNFKTNMAVRMGVALMDEIERIYKDGEI